jgi:hypothetical protein
MKVIYCTLAKITTARPLTRYMSPANGRKEPLGAGEVSWHPSTTAGEKKSGSV